jgi:hypothetical protein
VTLRTTELDDDSPAEDIDWDNVFDAAPDALWRVPAGTTFWESNPADMTGIDHGDP